MQTLLLASVVAFGWASSASAAVSLLKGSFEAPALPNTGFGNGNNFLYSPSGASWTFSGAAGISAVGGPFFSGSAPDGNQAAFLQSNSSTVSSISQTISSLTIGASYILSFFESSRAGYGVDPVKVTFGGVDLGTYTNSSTSFVQQFSSIYTATTTTALLAFTTTNMVGNDNDVNIDSVALSQVFTPTQITALNQVAAAAAVPEPASLALLGMGVAGLVAAQRRRAA